MTLKTCYKRLEIAKARGKDDEVRDWERRIAHKLTLPQYAHLAPKVEEPVEEPKPEEEKDGKKPKRSRVK
jgi:hypothetical protein